MAGEIETVADLAAQVAGESDNIREEHDIATVSGVDTSAQDNTWATFSQNSATVSFGTAFGSTPVVVTSIDTDNDSMTAYRVEANNKSTTGFDFVGRQFEAANQTASTMAGGWIAIGSE